MGLPPSGVMPADVSADAAAADRYGAAAARGAAEAVRDRLGLGDGAPAPVCAIVLGSGLGDLAGDVAEARRVPFAEVPGFPATTVEGHAGTLVSGTLAGRPVLALAGRFHLYEGHPAPLAAYAVRVVHALGARTLFASNAAGGVRRTLGPGDLMVIADHLNLTGRNPLVGPQQPGDLRFPDMSEPYDAGLRALLREAARAAGVPVAEGVYAALLGPSFETPAEVRLLERVGADAVGMSTVPETIVARALGMRVAGVSLVTNAGTGYTGQPLTHAEVLDAGREASGRFRALVAEFVRRLG
ncbi:purine nucleoside phosphorylase [Gemmatimonadetes bacterium T265]|nr:purine nucleoside phosphorylase [Gemmatimonadetes bacterium T265]